jgi:hypothetical protein
MKRKYNNEKVNIGDYVYVRDCGYESKCRYKVLAVVDNFRQIIIQVKNNEIDSSNIRGWSVEHKLMTKKQYNLPSGVKAWFVIEWSKAERKWLNIE